MLKRQFKNIVIVLLVVGLLWFFWFIFPELTEKKSDYPYDPSEVIKLHIEGLLNGDAVFVLTAYHLSTSRLHYFRLGSDGSITGRVEYGWGILKRSLSYVDSNISEDEQNQIVDSLYNSISEDWLSSNESGEYLITLSINTPSNYQYRVLSCSENDCPREICEVFDLFSDLTTKNGDLINLGFPVPCSNN